MQTFSEVENWYSGCSKKQRSIINIILFIILACLVYKMGKNVGELIYYLKH